MLKDCANHYEHWGVRRMSKFGSLDEPYDPNDPLLLNLSWRLLIIGIVCIVGIYKLIFKRGE